MNIALDLTVIQTPHRMRGIGATAINFVNNIPTNDKHHYVLYFYEKELDKALEIITIDSLDYEIRLIKPVEKVAFAFPGKLKKINTILESAKSVIAAKRGDTRISADDLRGVDAYIQFDQMQALPRTKVKKYLILYDLIPYVMEADYLRSYRAARIAHSSRKGALRHAVLRRQYIAQVRANIANADVALPISEYTKQDMIKYAGLDPKNAHVVHLGINPKESDLTANNPSFQRYITNTWGYFPKSIDLTEKPFLLFVGGADPRRKLNHLVAAYNNLRAQGHDIRLVFAGDIMKGPYAIPVPEVQRYIASSSYIDDIAFLGFVTDEQREWLYEHAFAMVYPSVYEGFGLPVLEAMQYGTPVITYKNSSIFEIAEDAALYAYDASSIKVKAEELLQKTEVRSKHGKLGKKQAAKFTWEKTTDQILQHITN